MAQTVAGYLLVAPFFAYEIVLYFFAQEKLGWWTPSDTLLNPDMFANYVPSLSAVAQAAQAGFWEECLFRAAPLATAALIGDRFGKRRAFLGGAMITFAVNGLIAWAAAFMQRVHGLSVASVGSEFGFWALAGGVGGALVGGRFADRLQQRWPGGRVLASGAGFVLGAPVCALLLLVDDLRWFAPLVLATYFFYAWYNGPLVAVILDVVPPAVQASVLGAFVLFSHLAGDALAPPLIGYLSDRTGSLRGAMLLLPAVGLLGGVIILIGLTSVQRDMRRVSALDLHVAGGR